MIAVVGSRDIRIGFGLAGVKNAYKSMNEVRGNIIVIVEDKKPDAPVALEEAGAVVVNISVRETVKEIPDSLVRQVVGASVVVK